MAQLQVSTLSPPKSSIVGAASSNLLALCSSARSLMSLSLGASYAAATPKTLQAR
eukprot:CAMPEP_0113428630 /NCGR_PEP_ID=MMETSP0013_2-20120614/31980_1 /TAXON_ID=2843 ORGANISM="Skeletonema costatum, Strain 1716" /NCGR_SAMPLE_ID=MMETSP0013_2 /ASSEMBLY_ACC=CAM_ASM_000158 /LENGTH=54 /DNA_ID=CAMNT_0000317221 /DNA_START=93 /DNA_END=254 /DNA_ORIENTATION=+ /assembly_acc=CAM_ASM_000158